MNLDANKLISSSGTSEENVDDEETQNEKPRNFIKVFKKFLFLNSRGVWDTEVLLLVQTHR